MSSPPHGGPVIPALAAACAALVYTAALGPEYVYLPNIEWLMRGDFSLHFFGWHLYRTSPWTLPLGATPHLIWPVGSSVGLTDSIPLASMFFKLIGGLLPAEAQFIGVWLVTCAALQGLFGALLMRVATPRPLLQFVGAQLFVLSPPFVFRYGHAALAAHWVLLASLWLSLRPGAATATWRNAAAWAVLAAATAAIQPYLLLMVAVLMLAAFARQVLEAPARWPVVAGQAAGGLGAAWLGLWQSGSLSVAGSAGLTMTGFGLYSANLLTFLMPTEARTAFAPGPFTYANPEQYEGYAYLGAGVLGLAVALPALRRRWPAPAGRCAWRTIAPLGLALAVLTLMALGPAISAGSRTLVTYDAAVWGPLLTFRTNGRMIWPLFYAVVAAVLFAAARLPGRVAALALACALAAQAADLRGTVAWLRLPGEYGYRDPLVSPFWTVAPAHYDRLIVVPSNLCDRNGAPDLRPFLLLAGRTGLAINGGATARYDARRAAAYCAALDGEIRDGLREDGALYVIRRDLLPVLAPPGDPARVCGVVDGYGVCVSAASYERWRRRFTLGE